MSKLICTLTGDQYRAAYACKANKNVRYYLDGIFISISNKDVVSTDGSIMYTSKIQDVDESLDDLIIDAAKIPANVSVVNILQHDDHNVTISTITKRGDTGPQFICKLIDGRYPDYKRVFPEFDPSQAFKEVCFSSKYLALLKTIFSGNAVKFTLGGENRASLVTCSDESIGSLLIMPCKL